MTEIGTLDALWRYPVKSMRGEELEEVEPGVFLTIATHGSSAAHVLRRVRFSKSKFSDGNAQAWWEQHRARIIRARGLKLVRPARSSC